MVIADVARGDGKDYSAFHVIDIETNTQVAEYKAQIPTKEYGLMLVAIATEYNNALLVIENSTVGWSTIQTVIERGYINLYFSNKNDTFDTTSFFDKYQNIDDMVAGFTMSLRTRPKVISKLQEYINDRSVTINSKRLVAEMKVFIWKNGKQEAQQGYNDDLIMSFGIGMYLRDTSIRYSQHGVELSKAVLSNISVTRQGYKGVYNSKNPDNPYSFNNGKDTDDLRWLIS